MLEWIQRTDFRVRVIGLVRNPHGVLASASKLFLSEGERRQFGWADMHRNLLAFREMLPSGTYAEIGDKDPARELLNEVVKEGDAAQQAQAQQILASLR